MLRVWVLSGNFVLHLEHFQFWNVMWPGLWWHHCSHAGFLPTSCYLCHIKDGGSDTLKGTKCKNRHGYVEYQQSIPSLVYLQHTYKYHRYWNASFKCRKWWLTECDINHYAPPHLQKNLTIPTSVQAHMKKHNCQILLLTNIFLRIHFSLCSLKIVLLCYVIVTKRKA